MGHDARRLSGAQPSTCTCTCTGADSAETPTGGEPPSGGPLDLEIIQAALKPGDRIEIYSPKDTTKISRWYLGTFKGADPKGRSEKCEVEFDNAPGKIKSVRTHNVIL